MINFIRGIVVDVSQFVHFLLLGVNTEIISFSTINIKRKLFCKGSNMQLLMTKNCVVSYLDI